MPEIFAAYQALARVALVALVVLSIMFLLKAFERHSAEAMLQVGR